MHEHDELDEVAYAEMLASATGPHAATVSPRPPGATRASAGARGARTARTARTRTRRTGWGVIPWWYHGDDIWYYMIYPGVMILSVIKRYMIYPVSSISSLIKRSQVRLVRSHQLRFWWFVMVGAVCAGAITLTATEGGLGFGVSNLAKNVLPSMVNRMLIGNVGNVGVSSEHYIIWSIMVLSHLKPWWFMVSYCISLICPWQSNQPASAR